MSSFGDRTRWLGDAYQTHHRKNPDGPVKILALVQTPGFVGDLLLDKTLEPAVLEFGLEVVRGIDPTCGCGHLLCQMFDRLWDLWSEKKPEVSPLERARRVLGAIHGVDLDPLCIEIARLRLVVAACDAAGVLPYHGDFGFWEIVLHNICWADALLPADHPRQPFLSRHSSLVPMYGDYTTARMGSAPLTEEGRTWTKRSGNC